MTGRARVPAPREGVHVADGVFSSSIWEGCGLREQSGGCRTGTRSLPTMVPRLPDAPSQSWLDRAALKNKKPAGEISQAGYLAKKN
jgi:hypothetical protein